MGIFDFFKRKNESSEKVEKPSPEQILFVEKAKEIVVPTFEQFGFKEHKSEIGKYSSNMIYRRGKLYLKISSTTYPTDFPYNYNIILGEGDSDDFYEFDWNSIALWKFKKRIAPKSEASEYSFPGEENVQSSLEKADSDLRKYGVTFLEGDLSLFHEIRKEQNQNREPYKIYSKNENGKYQVSDEPKSVGQKKKFS